MDTAINLFGFEGDQVEGNLIGTDASGTQPIPNGSGIQVFNNPGIQAFASNTLIGGTTPGTGNTIAFNDGDAIGVTVGVAGVQIEGNSIYGNNGLGIDLDLVNGVPLLNDSQAHTGPNNFQDFPVLTAVSSSSTGTTITGTFSAGTENGEANTAITLDFYANTTPDPTQDANGVSGYGQGQTYLGSTTVCTDGNGNVAFAADLAVGNLTGKWITATATDPSGNTSEFCLDMQAMAPSETPSQFLQQFLQAAVPADNSGLPTAITIQTGPDISPAIALSAVSTPNLSAPSVHTTITVNLNSGTYTDGSASPPSNVLLVINAANGTFYEGHSPAFTVSGGDVVINNVTFSTTTDAPTILVTGGSLTLRNDVVQESTGFADAAISVTGGTVDLGTATSPGGNTLNVNGTGQLVQNSTSNPITAVGDAFTVSGNPLTPSSLSGFVFEDFNDDGQLDFGEKPISGVKITLTGTDDLGNAVNLSQLTDSDGAYLFLNLRPGNYTITETQPAGYTQGIDSVGTAGGSLAATDQFSVPLGLEFNGLNYNFGEQPPAGGSVKPGQTAGIGFWNNKNGQALIKALNGGTGHQLADWLADTLPNMFGAQAGGSDLAGKGNAAVASLFQSDFLLKGVKLDAQVLATALSVYVTNIALDPTKVAASYGFTVSGDGVGTATVNVGSNGDAFGVANNTTMTVMDLLLATDAQAVHGVLYNGNSTKRNEANNVYSAVNQAGNIS